MTCQSPKLPRLILLTVSSNFPWTNVLLDIFPQICSSLSLTFPLAVSTAPTMATANLLRLSLSPKCRPKLHSRSSSSTHTYLPRCRLRPSPALVLRVKASIAIGGDAVVGEAKRSPSLLLDVGGMMCGACASRVRTILVSDQRVESAAVNMLAETAAVRLRSGFDSMVIFLFVNQLMFLSSTELSI